MASETEKTPAPVADETPTPAPTKKSTAADAAWENTKSWVRHEIELIARGIPEDERDILNPFF